MNWRDRIYCGDLKPSHVGKDVLLMGWVDAIRDHGNVLFIHLRDVRGIVQVVFSSRGGKGPGILEGKRHGEPLPYYRHHRGVCR
jgi:aspartyl-tRNA synthetase